MRLSPHKSKKAPSGRLQASPGQRPGWSGTPKLEPCRGGLNHPSQKDVQSSGSYQRQPILLLLPILYFIVGWLVPANADEMKTIELTDPVYPDKPKRQLTLTVLKDSQGFPSGYSMKIVNKVCLDDVCKLVDVTMYWDAIGFYQRLEYPEGRPLTKVEHDPFTPADYKKLDSILKDRESILNDHSLGFLATENEDAPSSEGNEEDVDGVSKATPGAVKEAVVKDAAWTTWVLWKYANTEIVPLVQAITSSRCSPEYLRHLLDSEDWRKIEFAIHHELNETPVTSQYLDKVAELLPSAGIDHIELAMDYIQQASPDKNTAYHKLIGGLREIDEYSASLIIELLESDKQLDGKILEALSSSLPQQEYYPIHLALRLIESRNFFSEQIEANVVEMLRAKDFFIARRASEFLSKQDLSAAGKGALETFREKNADRL